MNDSDTTSWLQDSMDKLKALRMTFESNQRPAESMDEAVARSQFLQYLEIAKKRLEFIGSQQ